MYNGSKMDKLNTHTLNATYVEGRERPFIHHKKKARSVKRSGFFVVCGFLSRFSFSHFSKKVRTIVSLSHHIDILESPYTRGASMVRQCGAFTRVLVKGQSTGILTREIVYTLS